MFKKAFIIGEAVFSLFLLSVFSILILNLIDHIQKQSYRFDQRLDIVNLSKEELDKAKYDTEDYQKTFDDFELEIKSELVEKYIRKVYTDIGLYRLFLNPDFSLEPICTISINIDGLNQYENNNYEIERVEIGSSIKEVFAYRGKIYIARDTAIQSDSDFYIYDGNNKEFEINTGPGLSSLYIEGNTAFLGNTSVNSQLQIFDLNSKTYINSIKLDLPFPESDSPRTSKVRVYRDSVYIGSEKWDGAELFEFDKNNFDLKNSYETSSQINDIIFENNKLSVAASDIAQLHIWSDSHEIFSPSGYATQEGKSLYTFGSSTYFGRTVGGFDNVNNHELFLLKDLNIEKSKNIGSGVYGIVRSDKRLFIATGDKNIKILNPYSLEQISNIPLQHIPNSLTCDLNTLIAGYSSGFYKITFK